MAVSSLTLSEDLDAPSSAGARLYEYACEPEAAGFALSFDLQVTAARGRIETPRAAWVVAASSDGLSFEPSDDVEARRALLERTQATSMRADCRSLTSEVYTVGEESASEEGVTHGVALLRSGKRLFRVFALDPDRGNEEVTIVVNGTSVEPEALLGMASRTDEIILRTSDQLFRLSAAELLSNAREVHAEFLAPTPERAHCANAEIAATSDGPLEIIWIDASAWYHFDEASGWQAWVLNGDDCGDDRVPRPLPGQVERLAGA